MKTPAPAPRHAGHALAALLLCAPLLAASAARASTQVVFESDGSSLAPFSCHYVSEQFVPTILPAEGVNAPAIEFATPDPANFSFAPYVLPALSVGQVLRGSLDFKLEGATNLVEIAGFGVSISPSCDYSPETGPADGRWPLPSIFYQSADGLLGVLAKNQGGELALDYVAFPISLGSWHHAELTFAPVVDGGYDFVLRIDGEHAFSGRSYEELWGNDALGALLGAVGSGYSSEVQYDNVRIEVIQADPVCTYGPSAQPLSFVRGFGSPVVETATWESCGGWGTMLLVLNGVSSARVWLNGELLLGPNRFNATTRRIEIPVRLLEGENRLEVELRSLPGSSATVSFGLGEARGAAAKLAPVGVDPSAPPDLPGPRTARRLGRTP